MSDTIQELDYSVDLLQTILWQFDNSTKLKSLIEQKQNWYDINQSQFYDDWFRDVFDLRTANAFGRKVWSIILGIPLNVTLPPSGAGKPTFGFGSFNKNFGNGNFSSNSDTNVGLTPDQQRLVLQLRYFQMITRCTIPEINRFMQYAFKDVGNVYVLDTNDMNFVVYVFDFTPGSQLTFILEQYDVLPRPAAVGVKYIVATRPAFGFGAFNKNFNNGTFGA